MTLRREIRRVGLTILSLALLAGLTAGAWRGYVYLTEVPPGHRRVDFYWLAKQEPRLVNGQYVMSEELLALDGKRIFVKGYMFPMEQMRDLTSFVLGENEKTGSSYGPELKISDLILVQMTGGKTANHHEMVPVGVAGTFRLKPKVDGDRLVGLFILEATHFQ